MVAAIEAAGLRGVMMPGEPGTLGEDGTGDYDDSMSCSWTIDVPGATSVALDFRAFELEGCCDWVTVYEGTSSAGTQLGRFLGRGSLAGQPVGQRDAAVFGPQQDEGAARTFCRDG